MLSIPRRQSCSKGVYRHLGHGIYKRLYDAGPTIKEANISGSIDPVHWSEEARNIQTEMAKEIAVMKKDLQDRNHLLHLRANIADFLRSLSQRLHVADLLTYPFDIHTSNISEVKYVALKAQRLLQWGCNLQDLN